MSGRVGDVPQISSFSEFRQGKVAEFIERHTNCDFWCLLRKPGNQKRHFFLIPNSEILGTRYLIYPLSRSLWSRLLLPRVPGTRIPRVPGEFRGRRVPGTPSSVKFRGHPTQLFIFVFIGNVGKSKKCIPMMFPFTLASSPSVSPLISNVIHGFMINSSTD